MERRLESKQNNQSLIPVDLLQNTVGRFVDRMVEVRRRMHADPEPSGSEFSTTQFLLTQLHDEPVEVRLGPDGCGLIVDSKSGGDRPRIAFRADIDALPIQDAKTVEYASRNEGVMHACGHDGHTACAMGAIWTLCALTKEGLIPEDIAWRAILQPAEETNKGAIAMVEAGAIEGVQSLFGLHLNPAQRAGEIGLRSGAFTADCVELRFEINGRGGHGARPHESRDPIATAAQLITSIYLFNSRGSDPHDPVVLSFGSIHGGDVANAIPNRVRLHGTMRCLQRETRERVLNHLRRLADGLAATSETAIKLETIVGPPAVHNDPDLTAIVRQSAQEIVGVSHIHEFPHPSMGGEDFANYLGHVPGAMFRLGCAAGDNAPPLHSADFDFDERALSIGTAIFVRSVLRAALEQTKAGR